jgi:hypothetical protein
LRKCWICGRTNRSIHEEIKGIPKSKDMMTTVRGVNCIQFFVCVPCKSILTTVSSRIAIKHVMHLSNDVHVARDEMDVLEKQVRILNNFFKGKKKKDELRDVA